MKFNGFYLKRAVFLLIIIAAFSSILTAQKKPTSLKLDVDADDERLCKEASFRDSRFCALFKIYLENVDGSKPELAINARNDMIEIVRGQVDIFYKLRKDGRSSKIRVFQTILDFLRIGGDLAVTIMNGERAKTIVGAALSGLDTGRTAFNKNFEILQTQILINNMNSKRALILVEIYGNIDKPARSTTASRAYSWYAAKNDLRRYLLAGTFDDALDSLIKKSGSEVEEAEAKLRTIEKRAIVNEATPAAIKQTDDYFTKLNNLESGLKSETESTKTSSEETLKAIFAVLKLEPRFKKFFEDNNVAAEPAGADIVKAIRSLMRRLATDDEEELVQKIENTVIQTGN